MSDTIISPSPVGKGITPEMPLEAPPEVKSMIFSFDPELMGKGGETTITDGKGHELQEIKPEIKEEVVQSKSVEAPKETVKQSEEKPVVKAEPVKKSVLTPPPKEETVAKSVKDEPIKAKVETPGAPKPIAPPLPKDHKDTDTFDYAPYSPEQVNHLKNMSRTAREAYGKLVQENKELAKLKDASYLQHEQGYLLHPEFQQIRQRDRSVRIEGKAWEQALLDIKAGKPFREINGFDAHGNPTFANERVATDADEIRIQNNLQLCIQAAQQTGTQVQQFPERYKSQINQDLQTINNERANRFAWVTNPEILNHTVEVEGRGQVKVADVRNEIKGMMPTYMRAHPLADWVSDLVVALQIRNAELREATNGKVIAEIKNDEVRRGEPSSGASPKALTESEKKGIPSTFSLEGFPRY